MACSRADKRAALPNSAKLPRPPYSPASPLQPGPAVIRPDRVARSKEWQITITRRKSAGSAWAAWAFPWPSGCSRPATRSRSGTAPAPRPSRWPRRAARSSTSSRELADVDVLFSIVSTGKDLQEVYFGKDGVLAGNGQGAAHHRRLLDHLRSTNPPRSASACSELGADFVASPGQRQRQGDQGGQAVRRGLRARSTRSARSPT